MNMLIRIIINIWLTLCIVVTWVACAIVGFIASATTNMWILSYISPLIGLSVSLAVVMAMISVNRLELFK